MTLLLAFIILSRSTRHYNGEYERWGDILDVIDSDRQRENNIPFKIEGNKVYIPEDAFNDVMMCCS